MELMLNLLFLFSSRTISFLLIQQNEAIWWLTSTLYKSERVNSLTYPFLGAYTDTIWGWITANSIFSIVESGVTMNGELKDPISKPKTG